MENFEKLQEQQEQIDLKQLKEKLLLIYDDPDKYEKLVEFAGKLRERYSDCGEYELYHFLSGSTPLHDLPKMDFPGEDSVEKFINSL